MTDIGNINAILAHANSQADWLHQLVCQLVRCESPSEDRQAVNQAMKIAADCCQDIGGQPVWHVQENFGDILEVRFFEQANAQRPVLLLGHLDTVWPSGSLKQMPWREENGRFWGPGVLDMKAGVAIALLALKILAELGSCRPVTLLLNSEEEIGSPVSRPVTERLALESEAVFVLEPAQGLAYKTSRKGVGQYHLRVLGVAAHSGVDFERGHSAIREMCRLIEIVSNFTDLSKRRTTNCGRIEGGTHSNVVAAEARADVDVRVETADDATEVERLFRSLKCLDPQCTLEVTGGINRPPMERTPPTVRLFEHARTLALELGLDLNEASTGGGSDGNFTSALGVPTLDGMGAVGDGAHAAHESVLIEHLLTRTVLLAAMITST